MSQWPEWTSDDGAVRLICGDCLEILPTLSGVDSVVTDPPYGIDYENAGGFCESSGWVKHEKLGWDCERPTKEFFDMARRVSRLQVFWGGNYFADLLPPAMRWLIWDKGQSGFTLADCEMAWTSQNKATRRLLLPRGIANREPRLHWTQKPVALIEWTLATCCESDEELICDTHAGSCTTAIACIRTGRRCICIEKEPKYYEIGKQRCIDEYKRTEMLDKAEKRAEQGSLFKEAV